jgi:hypothetical protein
VRALPTSTDNPLWADVDRLIQRLPVAVLHQQRLRAMRQYVVEQQTAQRLVLPVLSSAAVIDHIRRTTEAPLMLLKGLQIGGLYPQPWMRDTGDIDLLTTVPEDVFAQLVSAGYEPRFLAAIKRHHQLPPLTAPGFGVTVEIHRRPNTGSFGTVIPVADCFADAVASRCGVDGVLAPSAEHEFLFHLAHSWADRPLGRLRDLIDLELLSVAVGGSDTAYALAKAHGLSRVWRLTTEAQGWAIHGKKPTAAAGRIGKHLLEDFNPSKDVFRRAVAPLWADSFAFAARIAGSEALRSIAGNPGESPVQKIGRVFKR